jgi:hypothetical protein
MQLFLYLFVLAGFAIATIFNVSGVDNEQWYLWTVGGLLAIGLYASTYGISIPDARLHYKIILKAITVGVLLKALIIGSVLSLILGDPFGFILGIIVAQIDPLSTAALMNDNRMSKPAKAIIGSWASFDDPMTVILSLYAPVLIASFTGVDWTPINGTVGQNGLSGYMAELGLNLAFAAGIFVLWRVVKRYTKTTNAVAAVLVALGTYGLLIGALSVAVYSFWMLGIALIGLFLRPPIQVAIDQILVWALSVAAVILGVLLVDGINIGTGIALGGMAYIAQIIVGLLLTRKLARRDSLHIAFAQQNGITAIILALLFESSYPGTVAIVAPAIITVNILHFIGSKLLDMHLEGTYKHAHPRHHLAQLKEHIHKI